MWVCRYTLMLMWLGVIAPNERLKELTLAIALEIFPDFILRIPPVFVSLSRDCSKQADQSKGPMSEISVSARHTKCPRSLGGSEAGLGNTLTLTLEPSK